MCSCCFPSSDQVLIDRIQIIVDRRDRFDGQAVVDNNAIQKQVERIRVSSLDEQTETVLMNLGFDNRVLFEHARGKESRAIAANKYLHRVFFHLVAHPVNLAFGDNVAVVQENNAVAHHIDFVEDVARDDQVKAFGGELEEE